MTTFTIGPYIKSVSVSADGQPHIDYFWLSVTQSGTLESIKPGLVSDLHYPVTWFVYDAENKESCCLRIESKDKPILKFTLQNLTGNYYFTPGMRPITKDNWRPASMPVTILDEQNNKIETQKQVKAGFFNDISITACFQPSLSEKNIIAAWYDHQKQEAENSIIDEKIVVSEWLRFNHNEFIENIFQEIEKRNAAELVLNQTQRAIVREILLPEWVILAKLCGDWITYHRVLSAIVANNVQDIAISYEIRSQANVLRTYFSGSAINQLGGKGKTEMVANNQRRFVPGRFYSGRNTNGELVETNTQVSIADVYRYMMELLVLALKAIEKEVSVSAYDISSNAPPPSSLENVKIGSLSHPQQLIASELTERAQQQYLDLIAAIHQQNRSVVIGSINFKERLRRISFQELKLLIEVSQKIVERNYEENSEVESLYNYLSATLPITLDFRILLRDQIIPTLDDQYIKKYMKHLEYAPTEKLIEDLLLLNINQVQDLFESNAFLENYKVFSRVLSEEVVKGCHWDREPQLAVVITGVKVSLIVKEKLKWEVIYDLHKVVPDIKTFVEILPCLSLNERKKFGSYIEKQQYSIFSINININDLASLGRLLADYPKYVVHLMNFFREKDWFKLNILSKFTDLLLPLDDITRAFISNNFLPDFFGKERATFLKEAFVSSDNEKKIESILSFIRCHAFNRPEPTRYFFRSSISKFLDFFESQVIVWVIQQFMLDITTNKIIYIALLIRYLEERKRQEVSNIMSEFLHEQEMLQSLQGLFKYISFNSDKEENFSWLKQMLAKIAPTQEYNHPFIVLLSTFTPDKKDKVIRAISLKEWMSIVAVANAPMPDSLFSELEKATIADLIDILSSLTPSEITTLFRLNAFLENINVYRKVLLPEVVRGCGWRDEPQLALLIQNMQDAIKVKEVLWTFSMSLLEKVPHLFTLISDLASLEKVFPFLSFEERDYIITNLPISFVKSQISDAGSLGRLLCCCEDNIARVLAQASLSGEYIEQIWNNFSDVLLPLSDNKREEVLKNKYFSKYLPMEHYTAYALEKIFQTQDIDEKVSKIFEVVNVLYIVNDSCWNPGAIGKLLRLFEIEIIIKVFQKLIPYIATNTIIHCAALIAPLEIEKRHALIAEMVQNESTKEAAKHVDAMVAYSLSSVSPDDRDVLIWLEPIVNEITTFSDNWASYGGEGSPLKRWKLHPFYMALLLFSPEKRNSIYDSVSETAWIKILSSTSVEITMNFFEQLSDKQIESLMKKVNNLKWLSKIECLCSSEENISTLRDIIQDRLADVFLQEVATYSKTFSKKYKSFRKQTVHDTTLAMLEDYIAPQNFLYKNFIYHKPYYETRVAERLLMWFNLPNQRSLDDIRRKIIHVLNELYIVNINNPDVLSSRNFLSKDTSLYRRLAYSLQLIHEATVTCTPDVNAGVEKDTQIRSCK